MLAFELKLSRLGQARKTYYAVNIIRLRHGAVYFIVTDVQYKQA
jgi:hypothetical protein